MRRSLGDVVRFVHVHLYVGVWLLGQLEYAARVVVQLLLQVLADTERRDETDQQGDRATGRSRSTRRRSAGTKQISIALPSDRQNMNGNANSSFMTVKLAPI